MYLAYAVFFEGDTDAQYYSVLLRRALEEVLLQEAPFMVEIPELPILRLGRGSRKVDDVAKEACEGRESFGDLRLPGCRAIFGRSVGAGGASVS
jgi:hypothetical protein